MKKKITIIFCIIFIIFNFIYGSSKAADETVQNSENEQMQQEGINSLEDLEIPGKGTYYNPEEFLKKMQEGNATIGSGENRKNAKISNYKETGNTAAAIFNSLATFIVEWANNIPELAVEATQDGLEEHEYFTVYNVVMGKYEIFNIDFTDIDENINYNSEDITLAQKIKYTIIYFYGVLRNLSIGASVFVLIYIGIRMAISTVSVEQAKYKKMLISWLASIMLLTFMHFIIITFSYASNKALGIINDIAIQFDIQNIEEGILSGYLSNMGTSTGWHPITSLITVAIFVYYEIKFFIAYIYRLCEITVLTVLSPLVTITYSIDKVADNKAQAFQSWLKELTTKYSIQIVHAITYCIFISSAGAIAQAQPIFGAVFLIALDKAEFVFRKIFNVKDEGFKNAKVPVIDK